MTEATLPDLAEALPRIEPKLRRITLEGWAAGVATALATALAVRWLFENSEDIGPVVFTVVLGILCLEWLARRTRRRHEARIMPMLAGAAELNYDPEGVPGLMNGDDMLRPQSGRRRTEDGIHGDIAGSRIRFGEVYLETGGKHSRTFFKGVVAAFPNVAPLPCFALVKLGLSKQRFLVGAVVDMSGWTPKRNIIGPGVSEFELWVRRPTPE